MVEFRKQLDALGKGHLLTGTVGVGYDKIEATDPAGYIQPMDWLNLMTYDYQGGWDPKGPTDHQANLYDDPKSPRYGKPGYTSTDGVVKKLLAAGVPAEKMVLGVPFYGRGWTGVTNANDGLYQAATGAATGTWEAGIEDYKVLKAKPGTVHHDAKGQSFKFDGTTFWTYDSPQAIASKIAFVKQHGLGGMFAWELSGDTLDGELTKAMADVVKP